MSQEENKYGYHMMNTWNIVQTINVHVPTGQMQMYEEFNTYNTNISDGININVA